MCVGQLQTLSFVHIFQSGNQDSNTVLAVTDDVLKQLKETMPKVDRVHFRQDNAGCYHSESILLVIQQVARNHDISVGLDFSDPQGGKGSCDCKAAAIKNHIRVYLNSGYDVETADQMKTTVEVSGGVLGVRVMLCDTQTIPKLVSPKWDSDSFSNERMRVWRSFGVRPGKFLPWSNFNFPETTPSQCLTYKRRLKFQKLNLLQSQQGENQPRRSWQKTKW